MLIGDAHLSTWEEELRILPVAEFSKIKAWLGYQSQWFSSYFSWQVHERDETQAQRHSGCHAFSNRDNRSTR